MRDPFNVAEPHGQYRLGALQRLHPALLIHAQHQGFIRRIQIQPDNVTHLFDEERVIGKLEVTRSVWLQAEGAPDPMDGRSRQTGFRSQRTATPMRPVFRFASQGSADQRGDLFIGNRTRAAGAQFLVQSHQPSFQEPSSPQADSHSVQSQAGGDVPIGQAVGAEQDDAHSGHQTVGQRARAGHGFELLALLPVQLQRG